MDRLKKIGTQIRENLQEYYTLLLIVVGLPVIAFVYVDWRLALSVFIISQAIIGVLALRSNK